MKEKKFKFIGAASGWGAPIRTCEEGPIFLKESDCFSFFNEKGGSDWEMIYPSIKFREKNLSFSQALPLIVDFNKRLADCVNETMRQGFFPIIIGGDHSNALGTWNGVAHHLTQSNPAPFGLIWIDAHMDSHTPQTSLSGAWHGMSLAGLLGYGIDEFSQLKRKHPILQPENLCLIGTRSYEEGESKLLKRLGVKIYYIDEVKSLGLKEVLKDAIAYVNTGTQGYAVSLDLDVVDPNEAPGTGCFVPDGLTASELLACLPQIGQDARLKAFELVEFDPHRDKEGITFNLCQEIVKCILRPLQLCEF